MCVCVCVSSHLRDAWTDLNQTLCVTKVVQYTLANPNRGVSIKKKSVPISEFVRISEVIHLYGEFCSNHSKIHRKLAIQILINPSETYYYTITTTITTYKIFQIPIENSYFYTKNSIFLPFGLTRVRISEGVL